MRHIGILFKIFILIEICKVSTLKIVSLEIPSYIPEGQNLKFHCDYNVDKNKLAELDIKWYLGSSPSPFMVFLPHLQKEPQVVDHRFREKIIFSEGVVGSGFMMKNATTDMSGVYTCKVSTNTEVGRAAGTYFGKNHLSGVSMVNLIYIK